MLLALDTPQLIMMTIGFTGMLVFAGVALWLLKRQPDAADRLVQPPAAAPTPAPPAPVSPRAPAPSPARADAATPASASAAEDMAFEPTLFARAHVIDTDAPRSEAERTEFVAPPSEPVANAREVLAPQLGTDRTEFIAAVADADADAPPVERTEFIPAPLAAWQRSDDRNS